MSDVILGLVLPIPIGCALSIIVMCCKIYCELWRDATIETENPIVAAGATAATAKTEAGTEEDPKEEECTDPV
jgi:hypothetical protein